MELSQKRFPQAAGIGKQKQLKIRRIQMLDNLIRDKCIERPSNEATSRGFIFNSEAEELHKRPKALPPGCSHTIF
jgi:hypothetical protein